MKVSNYLLYDINNIEVRKLSEKEKRKIIGKGNLVYNLFNMVYVYELWQNGERYYLIYDKYYHIIRLVRDKKGITSRLVFDVWYYVFKELRNLITVEGNAFATEKDYGIIIYTKYDKQNEKLIRETQEYENIAIKREFKEVYIYHKPFPLEADMFYNGNSVYSIGIPWDEFIDLIHMVLLLSLSFKESF